MGFVYNIPTERCGFCDHCKPKLSLPRYFGWVFYMKILFASHFLWHYYALVDECECNLAENQVYIARNFGFVLLANALMNFC